MNHEELIAALIEWRERMGIFDGYCKEHEYTDTGEMWALVNELMGLLEQLD